MYLFELMFWVSLDAKVSGGNSEKWRCEQRTVKEGAGAGVMALGSMSC